MSRASGGADAYADATGANGPAGNTRAVTNFQANPGYQFGLDQATKNVLRNRAATGQLAGGGTDAELAKLTQGYANQNYNQYVQNLLPFVQQSGSTAASLGGLAPSQSALGNQNLTATGQLLNEGDVGTGNAQANADLAKYSTSANLLNSFLKIAGLGASTVGGGLGGTLAGGLKAVASPANWNTGLPAGSFTGVG